MNPSSFSRSRRRFVQTLVAGGVTLPWASFTKAAEAGTEKALASNPINRLLPGFQQLRPLEKIRQIEALLVEARAHPSGIFVCMPKVAPGGLRQVQLADFEGMDQFSENFGLKFKSVTDFFDNENSITTSGSHLAAQSVRYAASGEPAALVAARRAYASLKIIHAFGVAAGRPGFMGKPYHFEFSSHTTGDQYLHTLWGFWSFYPVASAAEQVEIREMIRQMADDMMEADFTLHFEDGRKSNMRENPTDYNAIMAALVAAAYRMTGEAKYRDSLKFVLLTGRWRTERRLDRTIRLIKEGAYKEPSWLKFASQHKRPDEFVHWEDIQHCQFTAVAAQIIHDSAPDILPANELAEVLSLWWEDHTTGFDTERWGYLYWFYVSATDRSWRACPRTARVPREQWFGGHPLLSYTAPWIYGDCLARFLWTAMVVARHCPAKRQEATAFCQETYRRMRPDHLLWISDPDGKQIPPELRYFSEFLSSEVPECMVASYWEGRNLGLWS